MYVPPVHHYREFEDELPIFIQYDTDSEIISMPSALYNVGTMTPARSEIKRRACVRCILVLDARI